MRFPERKPGVAPAAPGRYKKEAGATVATASHTQGEEDMVSEKELREEPRKQHRVGDQLVWFDSFDFGDAFCVAFADTGDCGDSYPTYAELLQNLS